MDPEKQSIPPGHLWTLWLALALLTLRPRPVLRAFRDRHTRTSSRICWTGIRHASTGTTWIPATRPFRGRHEALVIRRAAAVGYMAANRATTIQPRSGLLSG